MVALAKDRHSNLCYFPSSGLWCGVCVFLSSLIAIFSRIIIIIIRQRLVRRLLKLLFVSLLGRLVHRELGGQKGGCLNKLKLVVSSELASQP